MTKFKKLPTAELEIMKGLWELQKPVTRMELEDILQKNNDWASTTILNFLARLEAKNMVGRIKNGKGYLYFAKVEKDEYSGEETKTLLNSFFEGSAKNFIAALYQGENLSKSDIKELRSYLSELEERE